MSTLNDSIGTAAQHQVEQSIAHDPARRRRIVIGAGIGTAIEYYDFTIYAFLATTIAQVFFPKSDPTAGLLSTFAIFAASFFLRPFGGIVIGHLADKFGRRRALTLSVAGMVVASVVVGLIPSYDMIGVVAPAVLVLLRSIQAFSAGGELGTAASYVAEQSPVKRRGYLTGFVNLGTVTGTLLASFTVALTRAFVADTNFASWGWRIPFLISLPLGIIALIVRLRMEESIAFEEIAKEKDIKRAPALGVLKARPTAVLVVIALALTSNASYWTVFTYMSTLLQTQHVIDAKTAAWSTTATLVLAAVSMPFWSLLSDRFGRKIVMILVNGLFVVASYPLFKLATHSAGVGIAVQLILGQITACYLANLLATLAETLPASMRVSGFALGYNIASILAGGSAGYVATWLVAHTGNPASPAFFVMVATGLALVASVCMRETANRPLLLDA
ncbi:sugar (and other) transporter family protein [Paraburkholderia xenovorans LB400]|uniref:Major facilitator superfamily (MFS) nmetabolite/H+ symporter n=1 Tax=Paraburkholderia xenovorans (strain LB400) TaxID=266265 RepID=Q13G84_PARXL|nr:MFS transporter [Paraburkholderia xenovorans]ABE36905.1 major facilitator superfamily (MFS) nmetabolite/H+ symporter [Paraburkholderia xenovorans LB400]AIP34714.1 sugar (and other) transporter family protein [Paraburkholderia xenovorans LB400]